jgi:hypothetical protein
MISRSFRTLDGPDASGSSDLIASTVARRRRCKISMIWLSRRVRVMVLDFDFDMERLIGRGEIFRLWRIYSRIEAESSTESQH